MQNKEENKPMICRLCLISRESNCEDVEVTAEMLKSLGLDLDLNIDGKPVVCATCSEGARMCFDFKTACLCTEDCIKSFRSNESNVKLDLREIYLRKNGNGVVLATDCHNICRLCMEVAELGYCTSLNDEAKGIISVTTILEKYFPKIDLGITENPIICTTCNKSLHSYFSFINNCLDVGRNVKKYCKSEESSSETGVESNYMLQIKPERKSGYKYDYTDSDIQKNWNENDLFDENKLKFEHLMQNEFQALPAKYEFNEKEEVDDSGGEKLTSPLYFKTANMLYYKNDHTNMNTVKKWHENEENGDSELKRESVVEAESKEFNVKYEEINIKTEDEDTTRFQDDVLLISNDASVSTAYQCGVCTFKTGNNSDLLQHMSVHKLTSEPSALSCRICRYKAKRKSNLKDHMLTHKSVSEVAMYSCEMCTFTSKYRRSLNLHMLMHKNASEITMYSCEICTYKAKSKGNLKQHELIHKDVSEVTTYSCEICTYKTKQKYNLNVHMLIHKNDSEVTTYSCGVCSFTTKRKYGLKKHMLIHKRASEVTMYSCEICTYKAKSKRYLNQHTLIHKDVSEVTTYSCEMCTYKTKQKRGLYQHMLIHKNTAEITMYPCKICTYKAKRKYNLKKHMLIHKNYPQVMYCEICTYKTEHEDDLKKHMLIHENVSEIANQSDVESVLYVPPIVVYIS